MTFVVGVDYDSYQATLCTLPFDGGRPMLAQARFRAKKDTGEDLAIRALGSVRASLAETLDSFPRSDVTAFWVERGYGMSRKADWILGAYFAAIWTALAATLAGDALNAIEAREWKRIVTKASGVGLTKKSEGNPNAPKPVANEACRALLELVEVDGAGWTPDGLDAFGVAYAGRKLNRDALGLAAS